MCLTLGLICRLCIDPSQFLKSNVDERQPANQITCNSHHINDCAPFAPLRDGTRIMDNHNSYEPMRISCALTNGKEIWAFRYSSDDKSPSMYFGSPHTRASEKGLNPITTIASEPSDSDATHWFKVDERQGIHWTERGLEHFEINL